MYLVYVYDEKKYLIDKFVSAEYGDAVSILAVNYPTSKYEIRKVSKDV